jgi:hypothetical protein
MGAVVSESVALTAANGFQAGNLTGAGVRVAVVDLGFTGLSARISSGELPSNTVSVDYSGTGIETTTKHGTGVAEHILDMAPGVQLFCLKVSDNVDLQMRRISLQQYPDRQSLGQLVSCQLLRYTGPINASSMPPPGWGVLSVASGNMARALAVAVDADGTISSICNNDELLGITGTASPVTLYLNWNQYGN